MSDLSSAAVPGAPTPLPDLVWRAEISGLLKELTAEVLALAEVVLAMNDGLDVAERAIAAPRKEVSPP